MNLPDDVIKIIGEFADIFSLTYFRQSCKSYYELLKEIAERRNPRICEIEISLIKQFQDLDKVWSYNLITHMFIVKDKNVTYGLKEVEESKYKRASNEQCVSCFRGYYLYLDKHEWQKYVPLQILDLEWNSENKHNICLSNDNYHLPKGKIILDYFRIEEKIECHIFIKKCYKIRPIYLCNEEYMFVFDDEEFEGCDRYFIGGIVPNRTFICRCFIKDTI